MRPNPFDDPVQRRRLIGYGFVAAMMLAPFLGLLLGRGIGLLVMALALGATAFVAFDLLSGLPDAQRARIRRLGFLCLVLAACCLVAAVVFW